MIERKIIIGLITSTEFCEKIQPIWDSKLLESSTAKIMSQWCWEYFIKFNVAPGRHIEDVFYQKIKAPNFSKDVAKDIEENILPGLSNEYEKEPINVDYLYKESEKHLSQRHLIIHKQTIEALISNGELEKAEKLALEFKPLLSNIHKLSTHIRSIQQIRKLEREPAKVLLSPWLRAGQTTIIFGNYGSGKSLVVILVSYLLGLKNYSNKECEINGWQVKNPTGCLYVDGELGEVEMEERISQFEWVGCQNNRHKIKIFSIPEYQTDTDDSFYLSNRNNQLKLIQWLKEHTEYKLIILDSASTLFGLENENDNSEWSNKVNPFLRDLRSLKVGCILLHHSGKDSKKGLRGASAMGAMAHNIFKIKDHPRKKEVEGEAWFTIEKDKQRQGGYMFKPFGLHFTQSDDKKETYWEETGMGYED
jgi:RecA-family ATPase